MSTTQKKYKFLVLTTNIRGYLKRGQYKKIKNYKRGDLNVKMRLLVESRERPCGLIST